MAITTTTRMVTYAGNGVTTVFPFAFKVFLPTDLYVVTVDAGGNLKLLALGADYNAVVNADQDASPGGSITLLAGCWRARSA